MRCAAFYGLSLQTVPSNCPVPGVGTRVALFSDPPYRLQTLDPISLTVVSPPCVFGDWACIGTPLFMQLVK